VTILESRHEILHPHISRIHAERDGQLVDQALDDERGFGAPAPRYASTGIH
jgi:hypothetical protein